MRNQPRMAKKIAENSAPLLAEGLQLENRLKIGRPPHGSLRFNQGIKRKYPYLQPGKPDHLAEGQTFRNPPNPLTSPMQSSSGGSVSKTMKLASDLGPVSSGVLK